MAEASEEARRRACSPERNLFFLDLNVEMHLQEKSFTHSACQNVNLSLDKAAVN